MLKWIYGIQASIKICRKILFRHEIFKSTLTTDLFLSRCYDQWALITTDLSKKKEFQEEGIKICKKLLPIYPKSVSLLLNLGNIYHHMALDNPGYNKKAILNYKKALALAKNKS
jgi:tetratricopeptide (TPR) repeat protein